MLKRNSIALKLVIIIAISTSVIFAVVLGYNYLHSRALLRTELENNARNLALSLANRVEADMASITKVTEGLALAIESAPHDPEQLNGLIRHTLENNPDIYGTGAAFEPGVYRPGVKFYAPFFYRDGQNIHLRHFGDSTRSVPYIYEDWYQIPRELGRLEWSEPYYDESAGNRLKTTCSVPVFSGSGERRRLKGVVVSSVSLEALSRLVSSVKILETGYAALLTRNGMLLAHPLKEAVLNQSFFSIAEGRGDASMRELGRRMIRGESGFVHYISLTGVPSWMYHTPIKTTGWTLAVVFPERELMANTRSMSMTMAALGFAGTLLMILVVIYITNRIMSPLQHLAAATDEISGGNFDVVLPAVSAKDEVGVLTRNFETMKVSLKEYIRNLTETTATKERIESELKVATYIQASLLPRIFPAFPEHREFDIYASMEPAKEVGGDFYDFFFVDDDNLCFLIADVSDKGVPAALYMMVTKTLLKSEGQRLREPDQMLASVNRILAGDNESCMFTTVFCAILNIKTGEVRYANAGHNPPLIMDAQGVRYLKPRTGLMLGPIADTEYVAERLILGPGDALFLYTDGVTEAKNPEEQMFGEDRLLQALEAVPRAKLTDLLVHIRAVVAGHAASAEQSDDITLLAIRMNAGDVTMPMVY